MHILWGGGVRKAQIFKLAQKDFLIPYWSAVFTCALPVLSKIILTIEVPKDGKCPYLLLYEVLIYENMIRITKDSKKKSEELLVPKIGQCNYSSKN